MTRLFLILLFLSSSLTSFSCLNYCYAPDRKGHRHDVDGLKRFFSPGFDQRLRKKYQAVDVSAGGSVDGEYIETTDLSHVQLLSEVREGEIDWKNLPTDTKVLLASAGYDTIEPNDRNFDHLVADTLDRQKSEKPGSRRRTPRDELFISAWVASCLVILIIVLTILRRRRN